MDAISGPRKILVPTDFSDGARHALEYACTLAGRLDASLCLLHAIEHPYVAGAYTEFYAPPPEYFEQVDREVRKQLEALLPPEAQQKYKVTFVQSIGAAADEILAYVRQDPSVELIVMATHGRGAVARLMMGSVVDKVLRTAPCPVLTVRAEEPRGARVGRAA
jgi:universal stress protein A